MSANKNGVRVHPAANRLNLSLLRATATQQSRRLSIPARAQTPELREKHRDNWTPSGRSARSAEQSRVLWLRTGFRVPANSSHRRLPEQLQSSQSAFVQSTTFYSPPSANCEGVERETHIDIVSLAEIHVNAGILFHLYSRIAKW